MKSYTCNWYVPLHHVGVQHKVISLLILKLNDSKSHLAVIEMSFFPPWTLLSIRSPKTLEVCIQSMTSHGRKSKIVYCISQEPGFPCCCCCCCVVWLLEAGAVCGSTAWSMTETYYTLTSLAGGGLDVGSKRKLSRAVPSTATAPHTPVLTGLPRNGSFTIKSMAIFLRQTLPQCLGSWAMRVFLSWKQLASRTSFPYNIRILAHDIGNSPLVVPRSISPVFKLG